MKDIHLLLVYSYFDSQPEEFSFKSETEVLDLIQKIEVKKVDKENCLICIESLEDKKVYIDPIYVTKLEIKKK